MCAALEKRGHSLSLQVDFVRQSYRPATSPRGRGSQTHDRQQGRRRPRPSLRSGRLRVTACLTISTRSLQTPSARRRSPRPWNDERLAAGPPGRGRVLGRRARRRHDPRIGIHPADGVPGSGVGRGLRQDGALHPGPSAAGRGLGDLSRRPDRRERLGQGVFRAQARRD